MVDVFIDTDVAFDIISKREPHYKNSIRLLELAAKDKIRLVISECGIANLFYFSFDIYKIKNAKMVLADFISTCEIVCAGKDIVLISLNSEFKDKEDALQYYTALRAKAEYFVTRNTKDYKHAITSLPVYTPLEFSTLIGSQA